MAPSPRLASIAGLGWLVAAAWLVSACDRPSPEPMPDPGLRAQERKVAAARAAAERECQSLPAAAKQDCLSVAGAEYERLMTDAEQRNKETAR